MEDRESLRLAGLICSRLCHDLVGPAGAVANGLELLADAGSEGEALKLTRHSSAQLIRRLAFFRRAYGTGDNLTWHEAREVAAGMLEGARHVLEWRGEAAGGDEAAAARIVLNMVVCLMDATPLGARLAVTLGAEPAIAAEGEATRTGSLEAAIADPLASVAAISPREAQPYLTARLAHAAGFRLALEREDDERLTLRLRSTRR